MAKNLQQKIASNAPRQESFRPRHLIPYAAFYASIISFGAALASSFYQGYIGSPSEVFYGGRDTSKALHDSWVNTADLAFPITIATSLFAFAGYIKYNQPKENVGNIIGAGILIPFLASPLTAMFGQILGRTTRTLVDFNAH
jgi:hypothetical protein